MRVMNHGAVKLRAFLVHKYGKASGQAITDFTQQIDYSLYAGRKWLVGERRPRPDIQARIAKITKGKVTANDWIRRVSPGD